MLSRRRFVAASAFLTAGVAMASRNWCAVAAEVNSKQYEQMVTKAIGFLTTKAQENDGSYSKAAGPGVTALVTTAILRHGRSPTPSPGWLRRSSFPGRPWEPGPMHHAPFACRHYRAAAPGPRLPSGVLRTPSGLLRMVRAAARRLQSDHDASARPARRRPPTRRRRASPRARAGVRRDRRRRRRQRAAQGGRGRRSRLRAADHVAPRSARSRSRRAPACRGDSPRSAERCRVSQRPKGRR